MDLGGALLALFVALVVKVAVMTLAGWLIAKVYKAAYLSNSKKLWLLLPADNLPEVRVLWWALVLFAVSELTCGVEIYVLLRSSSMLSGIHAITSALGMGLFALGAYMYADQKLIRFGDHRCLGNRICRGCTYEDTGCRYRTMFMLMATFLIVAAIPPFFAPTDRMVADPRKYLLPFPSVNAWFDGSVVPWLKSIYPDYDPSGAAFFLPHTQLLIEFRVLPAAVLLFGLIGTVLLIRRREALALRILIFATGALAYTYFELILYRVTGDVLLGSLGHEVVEFWFLIVTAEFLVRTFGQHDHEEEKRIDEGGSLPTAARASEP